MSYIYYQMLPLTYGEYVEQNQIEESSEIYVHKKIVQQDSSKTIKTYNVEEILHYLLLFGQYPQTLNHSQNKLYLKNLAEKAIFKDIIVLQLINNRAKALDLLKLLAYQIGNLISYSELSSKLGVSTPTVQRYIEIFEQSFILYRLYPFSRNSRNEIGKAPKIYFWDLGIRNALINYFESTALRSDTGAMFENFIINEVKKEISYLNLDYKINYWRLKSGSEVDLILRDKNELIGCEIKLNKGKISKAFANRYPEAKFHVITSSNFI